MTGTRTVDVPVLARVEGEGALHLRVRDGVVEQVRLQIYEPPRFFEGLLQGRSAREAPDITARICGICPVAYQVAACNAVEDAWGLAVPEPVRLMRRLLYCGEWVQSHALHVYLLHAPDLLGYPDAVAMAADHRDLVAQGLRLKKAGNDLMALVGGRAVHPVTVRVGGFWRFPDPGELAAVRPTLVRALDDAVATVRAVAALRVPDLQVPYRFMVLEPERAEDYPLESGRVVLVGDGTTPPHRLALADLDQHVHEVQVGHSHALHARLRDGGRYLVGPLARWALLGDRLGGTAGALAAEVALPRPLLNPFASIVVRAMEVVYALQEALRILDAWPTDPGQSGLDAASRAGVGIGASEAPRGLLVHRYVLDGAGDVVRASVVPPTSQNQAQIEDDLRRLVERHLDLDDEALRLRCETAVRNHDPCISCATHAIRLSVDRG